MRRKLHTVLRRALQSFIVFTTIGCQGLLDVDNPTLIQDKDVATESGANSRRLDAVLQFNSRSTFLANYGAILSDERQLDEHEGLSNSEFRSADSRDGELLAQTETYLGEWTDVIVRTSIAMPAVRMYSPDSLKGDFLAQLFALRGYAVLQMAEDLCPGFPLNDVVNDRPQFGGPLSTDSAVRYALAQFDSSLKHVQDSSRFREMARTLKGRALINLGVYDQAAIAVAQVPLDFGYTTELGQGSWNGFLMAPWEWEGGTRMAVGEKEGINGLPFVSANDPRVKTAFVAVRYNDPADSLYDQTKYMNEFAGMTVASGVEAYLIRAEAALHAGDASWLDLLNTPRRRAITPAMPDLTDPGTPASRVDLIYRERAFWLYLTGRRLGDLRRLMRNYQRDPQTIFPVGSYSYGGSYRMRTSIPFGIKRLQQYNPLITGCTGE